MWIRKVNTFRIEDPNNLTTLNLGGGGGFGLSNLETLRCERNSNLTSLILPGSKIMFFVYAYSCNLSALDLSDQIELRALVVSGNALSPSQLKFAPINDSLSFVNSTEIPKSG